MSLFFLAYSVKTDFELGMDRALAAIHHDGDVEQLVELVEDDIVVLVEGIVADGVGPEIALDIMPVEAGAADRHHGVAIGLLVGGIGGLFHQRQMAAAGRCCNRRSCCR